MSNEINLNELKEAPHDVQYRKLSDIQSEPINWLWKQRIARGKLTMLAGDPGLGKSQLTAYMASVVTNGNKWAVDNAECPQGKVIFLNAEDDAADTIKPRLEAVGADLDKVFVLDAIKVKIDNRQTQRGFNLKQDLDQLNALIQNIGDVALVIIDPISAYMGGTDSHKNSDVRALLSPLSDIAAKHKAAVLCVTHLNKGSGRKALERVTGSGAFVAAARAAYVVAKDEEAPERRYFLPIKNNIGDDLTGFAFSIESKVLDSGIETSHILFENTMITERADEVLNNDGDSEDSSALGEAKDFLMEICKTSKTASDVRKQSEQAGISYATLRRAKDSIGIKPKKEGDKWIWRVPEDVQDARPNNMGTLSNFPEERTQMNDSEEVVF